MCYGGTEERGGVGSEEAGEAVVEVMEPGAEAGGVGVGWRRRYWRSGE